MIEAEFTRVVKKTVVNTVEGIVKNTSYSANIDGVSKRVVDVSDLLEFIEGLKDE